MNVLLSMIIAFVVIWIALYLYDKRLHKKAFKEIDASNGTFDHHAQKALDALETIQSPTPKDQFLTARIIDLNGHDGRINNGRVLNKVVGRYMSNLQPVDQTDLDWFALDQIENFADRHMDILVANPHYNDFLDAVLQARPKKVVKTIEEAKNSSETKKEAFETYVTSNITHTSDSQNVHDSAVNEQLRSTWKILNKSDGESLSSMIPEETMKQRKQPIINEIKSYINQYYAHDGQKKKRALRALDEMSKDKLNTTIGAPEGDILVKVWERSKINAKENFLVKDAVMESFLDMSSDGNSVVCSNGRCARILESLVHTDPEAGELMSGALTVEQIRNDALTQSNKILQDTIDRIAKQTEDTGLVQVAKSYSNPSISTKPEDEIAFKNLVKDNIRVYLIETFKPRLPEKDFDKLEHHCLTAVDSL